MSVSLNTTQYYTRSSFFPSVGSDFTFMAWVRRTTTSNGYYEVGGMDSNLNIQVHDNLWSIGTSGSDFDSAVAPTLNQWTHVALTRTGSSLELFVDGVSVVTGSDTVAGNQALSIAIFGTNDPWFGDIAAVKVWDSVLSGNQIRQEMMQVQALKTSGLLGSYPLLNISEDEVDYSGNGRNLTVVGSPVDSTVSGPPVPWRVSSGDIVLVLPSHVKAAPNADTTSGSWTPSTGATLYGVIDEEPASDTDYMESANSPSSDVCVVALETLTDPVSSSGHTVYFRYQKNTSGGNVNSLVVQLRQGYVNESSQGTLIASTTISNVANGWVDGSIALSGGEADSITDYSDLSLRFVANQTSSTKTQPVIEAADCSTNGNNTASTSWAVTRPAAAAGDLIIVNIAWDNSTNVTTVTPPSGPNGETAVSIKGPIASASSEIKIQSWYYIATGAWSAGTLTFTPNASEQWVAGVIRVPAGEFDPTTPIGASSNRSSTTITETDVLSPAFSAGASDGTGTLVVFTGQDADPITGHPGGWTDTVENDIGAVACAIGIRTAAVTNSESIASATWTIASDSWATIAYIVRPPADSPRKVQVSYASFEIPSGGGGSSLTDSATDSISLGESVSVVTNFDRSNADSISFTETVDVIIVPSVTYHSGFSYGASASVAFPHTQNLTVPSLTKGAVYVGITTYGSTGISTVTLGGISLTKIGTGGELYDNSGHTELWRLINPPSGSQDLVITKASPSSGDELAVAGVYLENVNQTTPEGTYNEDIWAAARSTSSNTVSSAPGELVVSYLGVYYEATPTGTNQTQRQFFEEVNGYSQAYISTTPGAASVTASWSFSPDVNDASSISVPVKPSIPTFNNVAQNRDNSSGTSLAATAANHPTGSFIAVFVKHEGAATTLSVSDTAGNTYIPCTYYSHSNNDINGQWFYCANAIGNASNVVTATWTAARVYRRIIVVNYTEVPANYGLEDENVGEGSTGTTLTSGNLTTTQFGLALAGACEYTALGYYDAPGTGWVERYDGPIDTSDTGGCVIEKLHNIETFNASVGQSNSAPWLIVAAAFSPISGTPPSFVASANISSGAGSSKDFPPPAGIQDDDILIAEIYLENSGARITSPPSGWTELVNIDATNFTTAVWWKRASSESGSYTFAGASVSFMSGGIAAYRGARTSGDPFDVVGTGANGNSASPSAAGVTTTQNNDLLLFLTQNFEGYTSGTPSGMTADSTIADTYFYSEELATPESTGSRTGSITSTTWTAVLLALASEGSGSSELSGSASDSISLGESVISVTSFDRSTSDSISLGETITPASSFDRSTSDSIGLGETVAQATAFDRATSDSISLGETIDAQASLGGSATDSISLSESIANVSAFDRTTSDSISLTDTIASVSSFVQAVADAINLAETTTGFAAFVRSNEDTFSLSEAVANQVVFLVSASDSLSLSDTAAAIVTFLASVSDAISLSDSTAEAASYVRVLEDIIILSETVATLSSLFGSALDTLTVDDAITLQAAFDRAVSDSISLSDLAAAIIAFIAEASEVISLSDSISISAVYARSISEGISLAETIAQAWQYSQQLEDALNLADSTGTLSDYFRQASDNLGINEAIATAFSAIRSAADTISVGDSISSNLFFGAVASDSISLGDNASVVAAYAILLVESLLLADQPSFVATYARTFEDTASFSDLVSYAEDFARLVSDGLLFTDSVNTAGNFHLTASDSFSLGDAYNTLLTLGVQVSDVLNLSDLVDSNSAIQVAQLPPINLKDLAYATTTFQRDEGSVIVLSSTDFPPATIE